MFFKAKIRRTAETVIGMNIKTVKPVSVTARFKFKKNVRHTAKMYIIMAHNNI